jgi:hypothetical protein
MGARWRRVLRLFSEYRRLEAEAQSLRSELAGTEKDRQRFAEWYRFCPPGHFNSPLPSVAELEKATARHREEPPFADIVFDLERQFQWLDRWSVHYPRLPFTEHREQGRRFCLNNASYGYSDAVALFCMLAELKPARVIEIGSGCSTAAILDTNERVFDNTIELTSIDPDLSRVRAMLLPGDDTRANLIEQEVQDVPIALFQQLECSDVLFVDSSHVSKVGSDVNWIFFRILPALRPGVFIHFHDVPGTFEYPHEWFEEGRAWNEVYLLRAFLMNNLAYRIEVLTPWLRGQKQEFIRDRMPLLARPGGGQLWIRKIGDRGIGD